MAIIGLGNKIVISTTGCLFAFFVNLSNAIVRSNSILMPCAVGSRLEDLAWHHGDREGAVKHEIPEKLV